MINFCSLLSTPANLPLIWMFRISFLRCSQSTLVNLPPMWSRTSPASPKSPKFAVRPVQLLPSALERKMRKIANRPYMVAPDSFHLDTSTLCAFSCIFCQYSSNQSIHWPTGHIASASYRSAISFFLPWTKVLKELVVNTVFLLHYTSDITITLVPAPSRS